MCCVMCDCERYNSPREGASLTWSDVTGLSEDELVARAREERATIAGRYRLGREEGAVIDSWEDPELEIYHTTDRYGFIQ